MSKTIQNILLLSNEELYNQYGKHSALSRGLNRFDIYKKIKESPIGELVNVQSVEDHSVREKRLAHTHKVFYATHIFDFKMQ